MVLGHAFPMGVVCVGGAGLVLIPVMLMEELITTES